MTKSLRRYLMISTFILFGAFLTACAPPPKTPTQSDLSFNKTQPASATPTNNDQSNQATTSTQTENQVPITNQKEPTMKTLQDFAKITAKEVVITTTKGDITIALYADKVPLTVTNFLTLAKQGFYNGIKFHRIIPDFMAQVGDPLTKDDTKKDLWGTGGPGYTIADEFDPTLKHDSEGTVSMANVGQPNTGGSQFFITFGPTPWLDGKHAVFGKVTVGMDVVRKLEIGDAIVKITLVE